MVEYEKRAMIEEEDKYTFEQSSQIKGQTGFIGYLRGDYKGDTFFGNWEDWRRDLKTPEFMKEFDEVINSLCEEGDILHSRSDLAKYCHSAPQSRMNTDREYYGVRVDTENYAYLLRMTPDTGDHNLYCYCYRRDWLDDHLKQARRGIRFIDPNYKEQFRIKDGDKIRMTFSDGESIERTCRYIDDYHLEVGSVAYHICEFAELTERNNCKVIPLRSDLPDCCYSVNKVTGEIIILKKGEPGFYKTDIPSKGRDESRELADHQNEILGVTKAQAAAMYMGSLCGFDTPGADPRNYDADGHMINPSKNERSDAR